MTGRTFIGQIVNYFSEPSAEAFPAMVLAVYSDTEVGIRVFSLEGDKDIFKIAQRTDKSKGENWDWQL